jgi:acyl phosphate:glycerol-3-phosphate acyltransferase
VGAVLVPVAAFTAFGQPLGLASLLMSLVILLRHRENMARILRGSEPKVGKS